MTLRVKGTNKGTRYINKVALKNVPENLWLSVHWLKPVMDGDNVTIKNAIVYQHMNNNDNYEETEAKFVINTVDDRR